MGYRRTPFAVDEFYHCYNRGVDKRIVFETRQEYRRFLNLLYLANDSKPIQRPLFEHLRYEQIFALPRTSPLVAVGAYCLMPNHIHLLLQEIQDGGITRFMHKVGTGYTMYFNLVHSRVGNLFVKPFRSKHVHDDTYLQHAGNYVHLNPAELFESGWKRGEVRNMNGLETALREYPYSSFPDYCGLTRPERAILDPALMDLLQPEPIRIMLDDAQEYYKSAAEMIEKLK